MSPQARQDLNNRAEAFIREIVEINKAHGMGHTLSDDDFRKAVNRSAKAVEPLARRQGV